MMPAKSKTRMNRRPTSAEPYRSNKTNQKGREYLPATPTPMQLLWEGIDREQYTICEKARVAMKHCRHSRNEMLLDRTKSIWQRITDLVLGMARPSPSKMKYIHHPALSEELVN